MDPMMTLQQAALAKSSGLGMAGNAADVSPAISAPEAPLMTRVLDRLDQIIARVAETSDVQNELLSRVFNGPQQNGSGVDAARAAEPTIEGAFMFRLSVLEQLTYMTLSQARELNGRL